jgi:predicted lipid-binding transport protein (Tim44 family)
MLLLTLVLAGSFAADGWAARLGGGKSFGRQSTPVMQRQNAPQAAPAASPAPAAGGAAAAGKPWGGLLGGLAAGLGLAWLAQALGLGAGFANVLLVALIALLAFGAIGLLRRGATRGGTGQLAYQGAGADAAHPVTPRQYNPTKIGNDASARPWEDPAGAGGSIIGSALRGPQGWGVPADFDIDGFTKAAERNFITLQDAWDRSDIPALRAMMTDGMLAEIQSQLAERERAAPGQANQTEVVMLEAQLLGIEEVEDGHLASVEFSGLIREEPSSGPNPFREVWNMIKPRDGRGGWLVAGVQALG